MRWSQLRTICISIPFIIDIVNHIFFMRSLFIPVFNVKSKNNIFMMLIL